MNKNVWSSRFKHQKSKLMETFNASIFFDKRLYKQDIKGSLSHAFMLEEIGILSKTELKKIQTGLKKIEIEINLGQIKFSNSQEDIHTAIESRLTQLIGDTAKKIHTARSRNDQISLDIKLYTKEQNHLVIKKIKKIQSAFIKLAEFNIDTVLPGYTHLQRAQPVLLSHHLLCYFEMLQRDFVRFCDNLKRLTKCPLGAGALSGSPIPINRNLTAMQLGFSGCTNNSMDTVADRDFLLDFLSASSILMMHLSRLAEELILWNSQEFNFVILPEDFCTGSSMMPQKINPDAPELIRGKTGRVYGNLISLLTTMKALPLCYNKDMQEDKEPLFDTVDTVNLCLDVLTCMLPKIKFNKDQMLDATKKGFVLATDLADYLVKKNIPFRKAHEIIGKLVKLAVQKNCGLEDLDLKTLKKYSSAFSSDVTYVLSVTNSINSRKSFGGTALSCVKKEITKAKKLITKK